MVRLRQKWQPLRFRRFLGAPTAPHLEPTSASPDTAQGTSNPDNPRRKSAPHPARRRNFRPTLYRFHSWGHADPGTVVTCTSVSLSAHLLPTPLLPQTLYFVRQGKIRKRKAFMFHLDPLQILCFMTSSLSSPHGENKMIFKMRGGGGEIGKDSRKCHLLPILS